MEKVLLLCFSLLCLSLHAQIDVPAEFDRLRYFTSPEAPMVSGQGEPVEAVWDIDAAVEEVIVGNGLQLFITPANTGQIRLVAQENLLPLIRVEVSGKQLIVRLGGSLETTEGIKVYVPQGSLSRINVKEGGYLHFSDDISFGKLELLLQSGAHGDCRLTAENVNVTVMGGSTLNLTGDVSKLAELFVKGGSRLNGKFFASENCNATVLGASRCRLQVREQLNARVENESLLAYQGNPAIGNQSTKLNGKIRRL